MASNFDEEMRGSNFPSYQEREFTLPDGRALRIGNEAFKSAEALFKPYLVGEEPPGIHEMIHKSILKTDPDVRKVLFGIQAYLYIEFLGLHCSCWGKYNVSWNSRAFNKGDIFFCSIRCISLCNRATEPFVQRLGWWIYDCLYVNNTMANK